MGGNQVWVCVLRAALVVFLALPGFQFFVLKTCISAFVQIAIPQFWGLQADDKNFCLNKGIVIF